MSSNRIAMMFPSLSAPTPVITTTVLPDADEGVAYSEQLEATGTVTSWSVVSGTLPDGLTLNAGTGEISGTPTTAGTANITVRATGPGGSDDQELTITVNAAFDLETSLEAMAFYLNPDGTGGGTFSSQALSGTYGGLIECTGNGTLTKSADALGTGLHGIIGSGTNNGHNTIHVRDTGDTADALGGDFMAEDGFWMAGVVQPTAINTNGAAWHQNDAVFRTSTGTFGVTLRSTPVVHAGGDTTLGQITLEGPAVTLDVPNVICVRKDATNIYSSVNGGAESSTACGDLTGMLTDALKMFNDTAFENTAYNGIVGKWVIDPVEPVDAAEILAGLEDYYA